MDNYIINSFIYTNTNSFNDIFFYVKRYFCSIDKKILNNKLKFLIKKFLLVEKNNSYFLTKNGNIILNDNIYYNSRIIRNFIKKYSKIYKTYELKEIRKEQKTLRKYLIETKKPICIICDKYLPLDLLETAHLKPRCILDNTELNDVNNVEFMCRYCHKLYDSGFITIRNSKLIVSKLLMGKNYDLTFNNNKIKAFNILNEPYFNFHYNYIFKDIHPNFKNL